MTLTELKYIVAVARERHFGRAAEACFVSQPTLSVAVKKLEDELGVQIFERGSTEISVTTIGQRIIDQAREVLQQTAVIKELAKQNSDPLSGPLRLGVIYTIAPYLLPLLVKQLIRQIPQMPLILQENFTSQLVEQLKQGELDAAIMALPLPEAGFNITPLYDEPFIVAMPHLHPWAERQHIDTHELQGETMLLLGAGHCFRDQVLQVCPELTRFSQQAANENHGIRRSFEGSSLETIRHMVASGLGLTVLPASAAEAAKADPLLKLVPFEHPAPERRVVLAWRKSFTRPEAISALKTSIEQLQLPGVIALK
ncbi:MAG: LysR family transcriptional regulator [Burkholderiales bacterium]|nr:LysR family transcriptional regulator [Burkholderiales bacterium]MCA3160895.1 LysR family transcriptional regulator [Burkholderiales bacterium]MCA3163684.1 LysR family transcriptional regulator [Burkholderiales bacterium]MCA3166547.1 LysR family transcriptional regulator [Burkholderiales bacterium]MCA3170012.1 LysR family transcriptional regulator [Burkholderiales bacterium]